MIILSLGYTQLIYPPANASLNFTHILFEWEQIPDAIEYELNISIDESFNEIVSTAIVESFFLRSHISTELTKEAEERSELRYKNRIYLKRRIL